MARYVEPIDQLILEIYVKNLKRSIEFYTSMGFSVSRKESTFAELKWEDSKIYLEEISGQSVGSSNLTGNVRIMVPDMDICWRKAITLGAQVVKEIDNRDYGLRDCTIAGPDGIGLRFGTRTSL